MTWKEFKALVEAHITSQDQEIHFIDFIPDADHDLRVTSQDGLGLAITN